MSDLSNMHPVNSIPGATTRPDTIDIDEEETMTEQEYADAAEAAEEAKFEYEQKIAQASNNEEDELGAIFSRAAATANLPNRGVTNVTPDMVEAAAMRRIGYMHENAVKIKEQLDEEEMQEEMAEMEASVSAETAEDLFANKDIDNVAAKTSEKTGVVIKPDFTQNNEAEDIFGLSEIDDEDEDILDELSESSDDDDTDLAEAAVEMTEDEIKEDRERLLNDIKTRISGELLDISNLKIGKPVSIARSGVIGSNVKATIEFPLSQANKVVILQGLDGSDIDTIIMNIDDFQKSLSAADAICRVIYNAIKNDNKPSYQTWLNVTPWSEALAILNGLYYPTYKDANFFPMSCTNTGCNNAFLTDDINIQEMFDFDTEDDRKMFYDTLRTHDLDISTGIKTNLYPITENLVAEISNPSIFSVYFEPHIIGEKATRKYSNDLNVLQIVKAFYSYSPKDGELHQIIYKEEAGNTAKTTRYKYNTHFQVISSLSPDKRNYLKAIVKDAVKSNETVKFKIPEQTCPKCGTVIPASTRSGIELLLEHHQLTLTPSLSSI